MSNNYNRKRMNSLKELDKEQARIKKRTKQIEAEWLELLDPQQLVLNFATNFIVNKLTGKGEKKYPNPLSSFKKNGKEKNGSGKNHLISVAKKLTGAIVIGLLIKQGFKLFQNKKRHKASDYK